MSRTLNFGEEHVRRYRETDGEEGYLWREGSTSLLLTTTGRRSGRGDDDAADLRAGRGEPGDRRLEGRGARRIPAGTATSSRRPEAEVQILGERFPVRARTRKARSATRLWRLMNTIWPHYDEYQAKTDREIPVVVLDRI